MTPEDQSNPSTCEVVATFTDREGFESAIGALTAAGFDRADLSVLASHESLDAAGRPPKAWRDAITALVGEMKIEVPLVAAGAVFLAGGEIAAAIAGIIGAAVGGFAVKEVLEEVTAKPHTEDFARALDAGSVIFWVRISQSEKETVATAILKEHGGLNVHTCVPTSSSNQPSSSSNQQSPG